MSAGPLHDRVVMVTGASGGIGRVLACRYAAAGADVAIVARRQGELDETRQLVEERGARCLARVVDIRAEDECVSAVAAVVDRFGRLDVLVNNAAVPGQDQAVADATVDNWRVTWETNLLAPMVLSREALRQVMLPARSGNIQFLSSAAAKSVLARKAHYATAKIGLISLAQTLAMEVGRDGVRVNTLVIGAVGGELVDAWVQRVAGESGRSPDDVLSGLTSGSALGRLVDPAEVAEVSVWLASDAASAITGQDINVTAGAEKR